MDSQKKTIIQRSIPFLIFGLILIGIVAASSPPENPFIEHQITNNDDACSFLNELGWECDENHIDKKQTRLPENSDNIFTEYNDLQLQQGCDLSNYLGCEITVYNIPIINYGTNDQSVYATLLTYKDKIIGGDIHSAQMNGFMHTLR